VEAGDLVDVSAAVSSPSSSPLSSPAHIKRAPSTSCTAYIACEHDRRCQLKGVWRAAALSVRQGDSSPARQRYSACGDGPRQTLHRPPLLPIELLEGLKPGKGGLRGLLHPGNCVKEEGNGSVAQKGILSGFAAPRASRTSSLRI
jgi:hypothetical protein